MSSITYFAEIITIGNEILSGRTVNTNASHIARRLVSLGFSIRRITTVMDELDEISSAFREAINRKPKLIISTGGLGPTYDDKTAEGLSIALNRRFVENEKALEMIIEKYKKINVELTPERRKMAMMPEGAIPVENNEGIAPGIYIVYEGIEILATPGVPREMENVLENFINRYLKTRPPVRYMERNLTVVGIMESAIAPYISNLVKKYDLYIKSHPKGYELTSPMLEIQIAGSNTNPKELEERINNCKEELKEIVQKLNGKITNEI